MLHTVMQRVQDPLFELIISNTDNLVGAMYVAETKTVCAGWNKVNNELIWKRKQESDKARQ